MWRAIPSGGHLGSSALPLASLALILAACGAGGSVTTLPQSAASSTASTSTTNPDASASTAWEEASIRFEPDEGDCLVESQRGDVAVVREESCDRPHDGEVFALLEHPADQSAGYPGDEATSEWAYEACEEAFSRYVGAPIWRTTLGVGLLGATRQTWELGERTFACVAYDDLGYELTSPIRDAGSVVRDGYATPFSFENGSCFNDPTLDQAFHSGRSGLSTSATVEIVECDDVHDFEVFALVRDPAGLAEPFPGSAELAARAVASCAQQFVNYVGVPPLGSGLTMYAKDLAPEEWEAGEREFPCVLRDAAWSRLDQSMRGSGGLAHPGFTYPDELRVGDCWAWPEEDRSALVTLVPCAEPHDSEVIGIVDNPAPLQEPYPGEDALWEEATDPCNAAFEEYVGAPIGDSTLYIFPWAPGFTSWVLGDRTVTCVVFDAGGSPIRGSVQN